MGQPDGNYASIDTTVPRYERFKWPKVVPPLSDKQRQINDDFVKHWHTVLPRYSAIEKFNHTYALKFCPDAPTWRTLELGAGLGGHLAFEPLSKQEYHCIELRQNMADVLKERYPGVTAVVGDCQRHIPYEDNYFDRVVVIHVLEHLPDLPSALVEAARVLKPGGIFSVVFPCDPGLAYGLARKISAERIFRARYHLPYGWLIRREHVNSPSEILYVIAQHFDIFDRTYYPLHIPIKDLNLCIGVSARKPRGRPR
jgi:SAM-dependent methyltransferase